MEMHHGTPAACLRDALRQVFCDPSCLIRPLSKSDGFAVVHEARGEKGNDYSNVCVADLLGEQVVFTVLDPNLPKSLLGKVRESYASMLDTLRPQQVTHTLVEILRELQGVRLRQTGGVYWLADTHLREWKGACEAAAACGTNKST